MSKIVKSKQSYSNGHLRYHCSLFARSMHDVRSKDAQKQLARTSLYNNFSPNVRVFLK